VTGEGAAVLCGVGSWLPPREVSNAELCTRLETSDEWISTRTGIRSRRKANPGTSTSDLAVMAGARALADADAEHVDMVVLATSTPDRLIPVGAPEVASRLGLGRVAAFDLVAGCCGFLYAVAAAAAMIGSGIAGSALVIGAETLSSIVDPDDRQTAPLLGDGAGAVVLRTGVDAAPGSLTSCVLAADGTQSDLIAMAAGGSRRRFSGNQADYFVSMRGREVFRSAVDRMAEAVRSAAEAACWSLGDIDRILVHQANARIVQALAMALDLDLGRLPSNIDRVGNTGAASIPILLDEASSTGVLVPGHRVVLTAFGGGTTWAALALTWPDLSPIRGGTDVRAP
jgi:3-oxoacyl-[acyl-carrier-protein] synthase-3